MHIFGPCHCLNEGCKWVAMAQMCMQHIWNATHIWTLMKLTITMWKYLDYPCSKWSQNSQIFLFKIVIYKFHSWQCIRLTIPSSRVNVAIGEFKHIICLKMIFGEDVFLQLPKVWVPNLCTSIQNAWKFSRLNPYLEIWNGLQSVFCPFIHATNNEKIIIFQSITSVYDTWLLRPSRWNRLWWQVQIMTNQINFHSSVS